MLPDVGTAVDIQRRVALHVDGVTCGHGVCGEADGREDERGGFRSVASSCAPDYAGRDADVYDRECPSSWMPRPTGVAASTRQSALAVTDPPPAAAAAATDPGSSAPSPQPIDRRRSTRASSGGIGSEQQAAAAAGLQAAPSAGLQAATATGRQAARGQSGVGRGTRQQVSADRERGAARLQAVRAAGGAPSASRVRLSDTSNRPSGGAVGTCY